MSGNGQSPPLIDRRRLLGILGTTGIAAVAGCSGTGDGTETGTGGETVTGTDGEDSTQVDGTLEVPGEARIDEEITPTLSGLPPGERLSIEATTSIPGQDGPVEWSSSATFEADGDGTVALDSQAPVDGAYGSADPMGLFWAMETDLPPERAFFPLRTHGVTLTVTGPQDTTLAETTTERVVPSVESEPLGGDLAGTVHYPPSAESAPGVVLLHGSQPRELTGPARLLAGHGFVAASLQYFGEPEPVPSTLVEVPVEYVVRACETLAANDRVAGDQVGLYGASKGAELALLTGANSDRIGAVVSVSGSGLVWEGIESISEKPGASSWSLDGDPVPYVPYPDRAPDTSDSRGYYADGLEDAGESTVEDATIQVEKIDGPIQLFAGGDDQLWNSERLGQFAIDRLERNEFDYEADQTVYDGAGHSITPPFVPTYGTTKFGPLDLGGSPAANVTAAREHWPTTLSVLDSLDGS